MKRVRCLFLLAALMLATGCTPQPDVDASASSLGEEAASVDESAGTDEESSRSVEEEQSADPRYADVPALPDFESMTLRELPYGEDDLFGDVAELRYEAAVPDSAFLRALETLGDEAFIELTSSASFLEIGDYVLYCTMDSPRGPSKIVIEAPDGATQTILDSYYAVNSISFMDRGTLDVELLTQLHLEGGSSTHYAFDLAEAELSPSRYGDSASGYGYLQTIYRGRHYRLVNAKDASELGEAADIYLQNESGEYDLIVEYAPTMHFYGDQIYLLSSDGSRLDACDLDGKNMRPFYEFPNSPAWSFRLGGDRLFYRTETESYLVDLAGRKELQLDDGTQILALFEEGYYTVNDQDVLLFVGADGKETPQLRNFKASLIRVKGSAVYFRTFRSGEINRYDFWKIGKDGENLTHLGD